MANDSEPHPYSRADALAASDAERIGAEIRGHDAGTDPFVAAVRATRMPMIITDPRLPDNPVVFANEAFCRLTGYDRSEIVGRNCRFLQGPETDPATVQQIRTAVAAGEPVQVDIRNHRKNGEAFWNRLLLAPVLDATGKLAYFFASQVDVTIERERLAGLQQQNAALTAELGDRLRALEESEARLQFATKAGRLGIWELDVQRGTLMTSAIFREHFGRDPRRDFSYAELHAAVHPGDAERVKAAIAHTIASGDDYEIDYRVLHPDGRTTWVQIRAELERDALGRALRMAGTSRDVTERVATERRTRGLLELDAAFRTLDDPAELAYAAAEILGQALDVSRAGYGTIDMARETITIERDWNAPGIQTLAGVLNFREYGSYIEDLKRGITVVIADASDDPRTADTADALAGISARAFINMPVTEGKGLVALLYLNHADARDWSAEDLVFVREVAHRTRMAVQRRTAEQALQALANTLETKVTERTRELMEVEAALRQAQKMEAVGQLTGGLAHDFNNLLAGISGSLELLKIRSAQGRYDDLDRYVGIAQSSTKRAAALTHRLLAFSRRQTLEPKLVELNRLVAGMEELIQRTVGPGISVNVVGSRSLWGTKADPGQIENSLLNLCINARDAMPDGGRLTIETNNRWIDQASAQQLDLPVGQFVALCVSDTGVGMTPEIAAKAFDPFFTTKPIGQGTGLGLSMIYGFARQSGGQARIYSEAGQGTTVCIYLPRHAGVQEGDEAPPPPLPPSQVAASGQRVLVVDDEPALRALMADALHDRGYQVLEAVDGPSAMVLLRSDAHIDLLVTDVGLPGGLNGRQVADAARALRPGLNVIFVTGYAENAAIGDGQLEPGMQVMTKPFEMEALCARISELVAPQ